MTPERAMQLAVQFAGKQPKSLFAALGNLILTACAEERHAALTEAQELCRQVHEGTCEINEVRDAILTLRDKEQP